MLGVVGIIVLIALLVGMFHVLPVLRDSKRGFTKVKTDVSGAYLRTRGRVFSTRARAKEFGARAALQAAAAQEKLGDFAVEARQALHDVKLDAKEIREGAELGLEKLANKALPMLGSVARSSAGPSDPLRARLTNAAANLALGAVSAANLSSTGESPAPALQNLKAGLLGLVEGAASGALSGTQGFNPHTAPLDAFERVKAQIKNAVAGAAEGAAKGAAVASAPPSALPRLAELVAASQMASPVYFAQVPQGQL